jgi:hypothetical protein
VLIAIVVPANLSLEHHMKNFLKIKHGQTEGEAGGTLAVVLLAVMFLAAIFAPIIAWAVR